MLRAAMDDLLARRPASGDVLDRAAMRRFDAEMLLQMKRKRKVELFVECTCCARSNVPAG
jgi:hypothetical protein